LGPVVHVWAGELWWGSAVHQVGDGLLAGWAVSSAELVYQVAEGDAEGVGYSVPGVERAARVAGFEVDQHGAGQAGEFGELVVGEALLGPEAG
jgi:hypothetical protein